MARNEAVLKSKEVPVFQADTTLNENLITHQTHVAINICNAKDVEQLGQVSEDLKSFIDDSVGTTTAAGKSENAAIVDSSSFASTSCNISESKLNKSAESLQISKELQSGFEEKRVNRKSKVHDQILCLKCLLKRKSGYPSKLVSSISGLDMGANQSVDTAPQASDMWEVWELNNNRNDDKKEWNSPNRSRKNFGQHFEPYASRSIPDFLNKESSLLLGSLELKHKDYHNGFKALHNESQERSFSCPELSLLTEKSTDDQSPINITNSVHGSLKERLEDSEARKSIEEFGNDSFETDNNRIHSSAYFDADIRTSLPSVVLTSLDESPHVSSSNLISYSMSPIQSKPDLPYFFCEDIYHIRSDSDLRGKFRSKIHHPSLTDDLLSRSTSYLSQCILEEQIDYFPCKDDSCLFTPKHKCYDWSLSLDSPNDCDKDHLTVSIRSRDEDTAVEPAYSYICSENEDLEGSFVCSDCGDIIPKLGLHANDEDTQPNIMKEFDDKDEFVLICYPESEHQSANIDAIDRKKRIETNLLTKSMCIFPREDNTRIRRLSGVHGSLENIQEIETEAERDSDCEESDAGSEYSEHSCNLREKSSDLLKVPENIEEFKGKEKDREVKGDQNDCEARCSEEEGNCKGIFKNTVEGEKVCCVMDGEGCADICGDLNRNIDEHSGERCIVDQMAELPGHGPEDGNSMKSEGVKKTSECNNRHYDHAINNTLVDLPIIDDTNKVIEQSNCIGVDMVFRSASDCVENALAVETLEKPVKTDSSDVSLDNDGWSNSLEKESLNNDGKPPTSGDKVNLQEYGTFLLPGEATKKNGISTEEVEKNYENSLKEAKHSDYLEFEISSKYENEHECASSSCENYLAKGQLGIVGTDLRFPSISKFPKKEESSDAIRRYNFFKNTENLSNDSISEKKQNDSFGNAGAGSQDIIFIPALPVVAGEEGLMFAAVVKQTNISEKISEKDEEQEKSFNALAGKSDLEFSTLQIDKVNFNQSQRNQKDKDVPYDQMGVRNIAKESVIASKYDSNACPNRKTSFAKETHFSEYHQCQMCNCLGINDDVAYGCLQCTYDRGLSQSTSESLLSADTGIDVDDVSLADWDDFSVGLENVQSSFSKSNRCVSELTSTPTIRRKSSNQFSTQEVIGVCVKRISFKAEDGVWNREENIHCKIEDSGSISKRMPSPVVLKAETRTAQQTPVNHNDVGSLESEQGIGQNGFSSSSITNFPSIDKSQLENVLCNKDSQSSHLRDNACKKRLANTTMMVESSSSHFCELNRTVEFSKGLIDDTNAKTSDHLFGVPDREDSSMNLSDKVSENSRTNDLISFNNIEEELINRFKKQISFKVYLTGGESNVICEEFNNDEIMGLKIFSINLKTGSEHYCESTNIESTTANILHINSCIAIFRKKKTTNDVRLICYNFQGEASRTKLHDCWLMKDAKAFALVFIKIAESSTPKRLQYILARKLIQQAILRKTCNINVVVNWILVFLGLIKSERPVDTSKELSKVLSLLCQVVMLPYFELRYTRQIAFTVARPHVMFIDHAESRTQFLITCINIEISSVSFSCKYPFKIFVAVHKYLSNLDDDLNVAIRTLDTHMADFLCHENSLDFVSDILIYLGLLKSEFPVNTTTDFKSCLPLLAHIVRQAYFPENGAFLLHAFIIKPNALLKDLMVETSNLLAALESKTIMNSKKKEKSIGIGPSEPVFQITDEL
ncbi:uncharacterized protein LOC135686472 isoform X2 [Rhopilema esculentum]